MRQNQCLFFDATVSTAQVCFAASAIAMISLFLAIAARHRHLRRSKWTHARWSLAATACQRRGRCYCRSILLISNVRRMHVLMRPALSESPHLVRDLCLSQRESSNAGSLRRTLSACLLMFSLVSLVMSGAISPVNVK